MAKVRKAQKGLALTLDDDGRLVGTVPKSQVAKYKKWAEAYMRKSILEKNRDSLVRAVLHMEGHTGTVTGKFDIETEGYYLEGSRKLKFEGKNFPQALLTERQRELYLEEKPSSWKLKDTHPEVHRAACNFSYNKVSVKPAVANLGNVLVLPPVIETDSLMERLYEVDKQVNDARAEEGEQKERMKEVLEEVWKSIPEEQRQGAQALRLTDNDGNRYDFRPIYKFNANNLDKAFESQGFSKEEQAKIMEGATEMKVRTRDMRQASLDPKSPDAGLYALGQRAEVTFTVGRFE